MRQKPSCLRLFTALFTSRDITRKGRSLYVSVLSETNTGQQPRTPARTSRWLGLPRLSQQRAARHDWQFQPHGHLLQFSGLSRTSFRAVNATLPQRTDTEHHHAAARRAFVDTSACLSTHLADAHAAPCIPLWPRGDTVRDCHDCQVGQLSAETAPYRPTASCGANPHPICTFFLWHRSPSSNYHDIKATKQWTINTDSPCTYTPAITNVPTSSGPLNCNVTKCMLVVMVSHWTTSFILPSLPAVRGALTASLRWHRRCCLLRCTVSHTHTQPRHRCVNWRQTRHLLKWRGLATRWRAAITQKWSTALNRGWVYFVLAELSSYFNSCFRSSSIVHNKDTVGTHFVSRHITSNIHHTSHFSQHYLFFQALQADKTWFSANALHDKHKYTVQSDDEKEITRTFWIADRPLL